VYKKYNKGKSKYKYKAAARSPKPKQIQMETEEKKLQTPDKPIQRPTTKKINKRNGNP
jgi:hypothetical protein